MDEKEKLGKESIWKLALMMGIPGVFAQLVNLLYNIVDRIYIGNLDQVGRNALAGLGLVTPIITLISAFAMFVGGGGAPLAAKALGEKNYEKSKKILSNGFTLLIIFSILIMVVTLIIKKPLLYGIGASDETFVYANKYLSIYLIGTLFVEVTVGLNSFITAQGKSTLAMLSVLIGAIINIILDPILIFIFNMGIEGAALATVISQGCSFIFVLFILTSPKSILRIHIKYMQLEWNILKDVLFLGISPFVMASTESLIGFVLNKGLRDYGGDIYVSLLTILQSVMMLTSTPITGYTQGVSPIISYNYGAKNKTRVKEGIKVNLIVSFTFTFLFTLIVMIFPRAFGSLFTSDSELIDLTEKYLPIFMAGMLIFGLQRAFQTSFVALGEAKISLLIAVLRKIILLIPLAMVLPKFFGVSGIYYSEPIADCLAALTCTIIFIIRIKKIFNKMSIKKDDFEEIKNN